MESVIGEVLNAGGSNLGMSVSLSVARASPPLFHMKRVPPSTIGNVAGIL
jgi:hypothetical protein